MKKKFWKILALVAALALLITLAWFANALLGNPISKALAERTVEAHLTQTYGDTDYYCQKLAYSFKTGDYYAHIRSESSIDTRFTLYVDLLGRLRLDTYDDVLSGSVTARRLDDEYRALTDTVFDSSAFPYGTNIGYGILEIHHKAELEDPNVSIYVPEYAIFQQDLIIDHIYDIRELGAQAGRINIYVDSETVTPELAAEMMLNIRAIFDQAGVPFRAMDFVLQLPRPEEGPREDLEVRVENFAYEDIHAEGMVDRVIANDAETRACYAELDKEK